jgi:ATP-dependent exoDNAse (exonuclease V) beta subunit
MICYGASRDLLESRFGEHLADDGDTVASVHQKIDRLIHPDSYASCDYQEEDQMPPTSDPDSLLQVMIPEQPVVASQIIDAVIHETHQLMFLQGSAGTGKTFTVKTLIATFQSFGKKCLICRTTGIAAV